MDWKEVIKNLKYLISEDCTDTQFDYADEIEVAIRVMENQEDMHSKIDKAIEEIRGYARFHRDKIHNDVEQGKYLAYEKCLEILKRNIGESK